MKYAITPEGRYCSHTTIPQGHIECAERPLGYVLMDNWQINPLNTLLCWREKTAQEIDDKEDIETTKRFNGNKIIKIIAQAFLEHENRLREIESKNPVTLPQLITAMRKL